MKNMLMSVWCRFVGHAWRRARKGEDVALSYCRRCEASRPVHTRKKVIA